MFWQSRRSDMTCSRLAWQIQELKLAMVNLAVCRVVS